MKTPSAFATYLSSLLFSLLLPCLAMAQTNNAPAPTAMPGHQCARPVIKGKIDSDEAYLAFEKQLADYKACILAYVEAQKKLAAPYIDVGTTVSKEFAAYVSSSPAVATALKSAPSSPRQ